MRRRHTPERQEQGERAQVRVIAGRWRGRPLLFNARPGLRPTPNRVRETLFNWLQGEVAGARVLDLFAGSGALAFEALSRGAASAVLLEADAQSARQLREQAALFAASEVCDIHQDDALRWLQKTATPCFDLVFLDPPFDARLWQAALQLLHERAWLSPDAWVYVEAPRRQELALPEDPWSPHRQLIAGDVCARLLRYRPVQSAAVIDTQ